MIGEIPTQSVNNFKILPDNYYGIPNKTPEQTTRTFLNSIH